MILRFANENDAKELSEIYSPYVLESSVTFEILAPCEEEFKKRITHIQKDFPYLVAVENNHILGYCYAHKYAPRDAYRFLAEASVYIKRENAHTGIGEVLYQALLEILKKQNYLSVIAIISTPNTASEKFHEKCGFQKVGELKNMGYKMGQYHNIVYFRKDLSLLKTPPEEPLGIGAICEEAKTIIEKINLRLSKDKTIK